MPKELTLRQAANLLRDIDKELEKMDLKSTDRPMLNISPFNSIEKSKKLADARLEEFMFEKQALEKLIGVKFEIRALIDEANHKVGISKLLNAVSKAKKSLLLYAESDYDKADWEMIENTFAKQTADSGFRGVVVNCMDEANQKAIEKSIANYKQVIKKSNDEIIVLNISTKIQLNSQIESVLDCHNFVY